MPALNDVAHDPCPLDAGPGLVDLISEVHDVADLVEGLELDAVVQGLLAGLGHPRRAERREVEAHGLEDIANQSKLRSSVDRTNKEIF